MPPDEGRLKPSCNRSRAEGDKRAAGAQPTEQRVSFRGRKAHRFALDQPGNVRDDWWPGARGPLIPASGQFAGQAIAAVIGCPRDQTIPAKSQAAGWPEPATSTPDGKRDAALAAGHRLTNPAAVDGGCQC
jgi:hypothetical protein